MRFPLSRLTFSAVTTRADPSRNISRLLRSPTEDAAGKQALEQFVNAYSHQPRPYPRD